MEITGFEVLGTLPDLLSADNRTPDTGAWERRRAEIYRNAVDLQFGTMPPTPEFVRVETLYIGGYGKINSYRIVTGLKAHPVSFIMQVHMPEKDKAKLPLPVVIDGDGCFPYTHNGEISGAVKDAGMCYAVFNRTELAPDVREAGRCGPLYETYPEYTFGAIGAWAWGYSRCTDALLKLGFADAGNIAFTGHSRGGKTALLAGAIDTRARFVNPNGSGAGGAGCFRVHMRAKTSEGVEKRSEMLSDLMAKVDFWFSSELAKYKDDEVSLPFDEHMLKALVAPRILIDTEAEDDIWANPAGTYLTNIAAREVWRLYGCEENFVWHWRRGAHFHKVEDINILLKIMRNRIYGETVVADLMNLPFEPPAPIHKVIV